MLNNKIKGWIFVFIQFLLIILLLYFCYSDAEKIGDKKSILSVLGISITITGFILMVLVFFSFKQPMTPNPIPSEKTMLRTTGFYKYIRHPMYSCVLLSLIGVVIYFKSVPGLITWLAAVIFIINKIKFEEKRLLEKFPEYNDYTKNTKKLIPYTY